MKNQLLAELERKMKKAVEVLEHEFLSLRTGRANPALVADLEVDYYNTPTPLKQIAGISVLEGRTILIQPWDTSAIPEIEKAIMKSNLGLMPSNDGKVVRVPVPPLSDERRQELDKIVKRMAEDARVAIRNVRREVREQLKKLQKEGQISEDDERRLEHEMQKATDDFIKQVDELLSRKEREILEE